MIANDDAILNDANDGIVITENVSEKKKKSPKHVNVSESQSTKKPIKKKASRVSKLDLEEIKLEIIERTQSINNFLQNYTYIIFDVANASKTEEDANVASDVLEPSSTTTINSDGKVEEIDTVDIAGVENMQEGGLTLSKKPEYLEIYEKFGEDVTFFREASIYGRGSAEKRLGVASYLHNANCHGLFSEIWNLGLQVEFLENENKIIYLAMKCIMITVWNSSDRSKELSEDILTDHNYKDIFRYLKDSRLLLTSEDSSNELPRLIPVVYFIKGLLGILHNVANHCSRARELFRDASAVEIFFGFKSVRNLMIKCKANMLLAYIINEDESERVFADTRSVGFIVGILANAMNSADRHSKKYGFHAGELVNGMNKMAANDSNKIRIIEAGALPHYVRLLKPDCTPREQIQAAEGIWIFSFKCADTIKNNEECVPVLQRIVAESDNEELKRMASGALWVLQGDCNGSRSQRNHSKTQDNQILTSLTIQKEEDDHIKGETDIQHIMLSYQWSFQPMMLKVKQCLVDHGYKVWMDVDYMSGSILEAMALAVENSSVVITALSQKYKESPNCRTEAEYAFKCNRSIVPLRAEERYKPNGWLGALTANKLYFDFSEGRNFKRAMENLMKELGERGKVSSNLTSETPIVKQQEIPNGPGTNSPDGDNKINLVSWKIEDVSHWLETIGLDGYKQSFVDFTGDSLKELLNMRYDAPEYYHRILVEQFHMKLADVLKLTSSLKKL